MYEYINKVWNWIPQDNIVINSISNFTFHATGNFYYSNIEQATFIFFSLGELSQQIGNFLRYIYIVRNMGQDGGGTCA